MGKFDGKVLLELGTSVGSEDIIRYVKENGGKVLVADYYEPERSKSKKIADAHFEISTVEIEAIARCAKENGVSAIYCGVSELNLECARKASEAIGLKTLYTAEQWKRFMNKNSFRELCELYNVPTPRTYYKGYIDGVFYNSAEFVYPLIVKPDDSCANQGISICYSEADLQYALNVAAGKSKSASLIIEELVDGIEVSSTYVIQNGICKLVCYGDKYAYISESGLRALSNAYVYPGNDLNKYLLDVDPFIQKMIIDEGLDNCTIFFQGIYDGCRFAMFEAGLRMEGTASYRIVDRINSQNFMQFLVDTVLECETDYDITKNDATFEGRRCIKYSMISTGGLLTKVEGFDTLENKNIISKEQRHAVGEVIASDGTLRQLLFRFDILADNLIEAVETIKQIKAEVKAFDEQGNNMIAEGFDPEILIGKVG